MSHNLYEPPKGPIGMPFFELWFVGLFLAAIVGSLVAALLVPLLR